MQVVFFATPIGMILLVLLIGFVFGIGITVLLYRTQRPAPSDISSFPVTQRDPSNPYEPSTVGLRAPSTTGCAIAFAVLLIAAITLIAFAATYFFAATKVVNSVPAPMPPPPTRMQPQLAPATEIPPPSN